MYIITGASRGIGKFLFDELSARNERVLGLFSSVPVKKSSVHAQVDVASQRSVDTFFENYGPDLKEIVLINCAGINYNAVAHKHDPERWRNVLDVNLVGAFYMSSKALPLMRAEGYGRIINLSSVVAQRGVAGTSAYAASKAALWGMTRSLAVENAAKNVTINCINLGYFDIGMIDQVPGDLRSAIVSAIPAGRLGRPNEILRTVDYIVETGYLNGTSIDLNGAYF